ncbi:50S ribosomal protein L24 [Theileria orientalis strain Shintoku]|uniref:Large ribosomal subunit protein uL24c n=1 Tax=Theileria orientalis strain Shintoku TaxID=869250 RepID=J4D717_THEOR|nr:50S ribosomal protein L24 [Theileria orientalis strain Shintoku]BAM39900.1 50S ribosomal protein L24 [Theileria orientalis strain Shintoku]|eukprot:XP_009690201.1 50S ribosomal protein L24 [Theileria orientalis strain Shintoku]
MLFHTLKRGTEIENLITGRLFNTKARYCSSLCSSYRRNIWNLNFSRVTNSNSLLSEHTHTDLDIVTNRFTYWQTRGPKIVKPRDIIKRWKIRPGDKVVVISGKDKGKTGEVLMCDKLRNQVKVKGCNMRKLLVDSQVVQIEKKMHYSNVQLVDKLLNVGTRVTIKYTPDNKPLRVSKKSGYVIPWPEKVGRLRRNVALEEKGTQRYSSSYYTGLEVFEGEKDTKPEEALRRTYDYHKDLFSMNLLRQTMSKYNREIS